jgi:hypothetical protein
VKSDLNTALVFERRKVYGLLVIGHGRISDAVESVVVVAIGPVSQGGRFALIATGFYLTAFVKQIDFSSNCARVFFAVCGEKVSTFNGLQAAMCHKVLL